MSSSSLGPLKNSVVGERICRKWLTSPLIFLYKDWYHYANSKGIHEKESWEVGIISTANKHYWVMVLVTVSGNISPESRESKIYFRMWATISTTHGKCFLLIKCIVAKIIRSDFFF